MLSDIDLGRGEIAVLVSGICSMGLEILAGRMVAPAFGNSIYTWGSIIGVFMASLSLGYYVGGRRSDRASPRNVATILLQAALYVGFLILADSTIITLADALPVPARYSALLPIVILFGPPVYILGLITPYAAELSSKTRKGEASGQVFALGTIGSIAGTFATTFLLIPWFSVDTILLIIGTALILGSLLVARPELRQHQAIAVVAALALAGSYGWSTAATGVDGTTVYHTQTPYQELRVVDHDGVRTLYLNGQPNSAMDLSGEDPHVFRYTPYFHMPFLLNTSIQNVLFIGGGGFTGPKHFLDLYNVTVDVVEIDPEVVRAAKQFFNVSNGPRMEIHVMDGREHLEQTSETYDLIVLDAYRKDRVPFHLTTRQFFQLVHDRLDSDGVVLSNLISTASGPGSKFFRSEYRTIASVFPSVYAFATADTSMAQNIEVIATKQPTSLTEQDLLARNRRQDIGVNLSEQIRFMLHNISTSDVPLLRDDRAPVDRLLDPLLGTAHVTAQ